MANRPRADILNIGFLDWDGEQLLTGGAERYISDLVAVLAEQGYSVRLLQNANKPFTRHWRGIEVVGIAAAREFDLQKLASAFGPLVHDAALVIASPVELASQIAAGPAVIGINHGVWWDNPDVRVASIDPSRHATLLAALRRVAACVCVDTNFINWLRTFDGESSDRLEYVPNYVDLKQFAPRDKDFHAQRLSVLFPRRLRVERGILEVFAAFDELFASDQPFDLHLCGGGPPSDVARARDFVARHPGRARWTEAAMIDMPAVYGTSHIVMIPTLFSEGTSLACLEAMATRNGVVATHVGGLPNLVLDGVNGLLIKPGAAALVSALCRLADDRALLADLADRAVAVSAAFSIEQWQSRWREIVQRVVGMPDSVQRSVTTSNSLKRINNAGFSTAPRRTAPRSGQDAKLDNHTPVVRMDNQTHDDGAEALRIAHAQRDTAYRATLVASLERDAAVSDAALAEKARDEVLAARDEVLLQRDQALAARDDAFLDRANALAARDEARQDLRAAIRQRESIAEECERVALERDQLARAALELDAIKSSRGWAGLQFLYRVGHVLMPWRKTTVLPSVVPDATPPALPVLAPETALVPSSMPELDGNTAGVRAVLPTNDDVHAAPDDVPPAPVWMRPECCALVPGLVSVVLPVYNGAQLLEFAIVSVLAQTYRPLELIIVDDGSADGAEAVLERYAGRPEVRIFVQSNQRLPRALTQGFAHARGEFWTWISADNMMGPRQIERMVTKLRAEPGLGMTYADYWVIDERGNPLADRTWRAINRRDPATGEVHLPHTTERLNLIPENFIGPCFLYRGWIGCVLGEYDPAQGIEDYDYWMRINALFSIRHLGTEELLYWYRVHANTLSARADEHAIPDKVEALMRTEVARAEYFAKPLALRADPEAAAWLAARGIVDGIGEISQEANAAPTAMVAIANAADALALPTEAGNAIPLVLIFAPGGASPYDVATLLARPNVLAVVSNARDAARVRALAPVPIVDGEAADLQTAIVAFARDRGFRVQTREPVRSAGTPALPFVRSTKSARIALQIETTVREAGWIDVVALAVALRQAGFDPLLLVRGVAGDRPKRTTEIGLLIEERDDLFTEEVFCGWLRDQKIDLVNAHCSPFGAAAAASLGIPFVQTLDEPDLALSPEFVAHLRDCDAATTTYACATTAVGKYADFILGLDPAKIHVIGHGINANAHRGACLTSTHASLFRALLRG